MPTNGSALAIAWQAPCIPHWKKSLNAMSAFSISHSSSPVPSGGGCLHWFRATTPWGKRLMCCQRSLTLLCTPFGRAIHLFECTIEK